MKRAVWFVSILVLLTSCMDIPYFTESKSVDESGWLSKDTLEFNFTIIDPSNKFKGSIDLRHNGDYPYSNLYLFIDITYPNNMHRLDTLECILADNRGRWYGSGLGDMVSHRIEYLPAIQFPLEGHYQMNISHGMRRDPIEEITDLGLRLENLSLESSRN
tara:strand:+ start:1261 stop:1740 length:480 start_codon:yes stop_codon:yes gene_type:complete